MAAAYLASSADQDMHREAQRCRSVGYFLERGSSVSDPEPYPELEVFCIRIRNPDPHPWASKKF